MGFFGNLIDDILDLPAKLVETPFKVVDRLVCAGDHNWSKWHYRNGKNVRECYECGTKERE